MLSQRTAFKPALARNPAGSRRVSTIVRADAGPSPDMQEAIKKAMSDPKVAAQVQAYQEAMKRPEVQQQMAAMQSVMMNPKLQQRMQELRNDPDMADFWKEIQTGGMQALMKYYNDPAFLAKLGSKLGNDVQSAMSGSAAAAGAVPPQAQAPPEVKDLIDAAKYGDLEAAEDFIAIGKDVGMKDKEGRTPLHFAAGFNHVEIAKMLIEENAPLEATDALGNTPLHYAAGYGRPDLVSLLLAAGSDKTARNKNGKSAYDLATADSRNPVSQSKELVEKLKL